MIVDRRFDRGRSSHGSPSHSRPGAITLRSGVRGLRLSRIVEQLFREQQPRLYVGIALPLLKTRGRDDLSSLSSPRKRGPITPASGILVPACARKTAERAFKDRDVSGYVKAVRALLRAPTRNHRALELEWDRLGRRALLECELNRARLAAAP